jgi:hypothetical protein
LASNDFHAFDLLKNDLSGKRFADDEAVETGVEEAETTIKRLQCCEF